MIGAQTPLPFGHALEAGAITGLIAAAVSVAVGMTVTTVTGRSYPMIGPPAMAIAAFIGILLGTPVYWLLARKSGGGRPLAWVIVCAAVVTLYSIAQVFNPQLKDVDGSVLLVNSLHVAVGAVAAFVLPRFASR